MSASDSPLPAVIQVGIDHRQAGLDYLDRLPRFAGIGDVGRIGLPVDECARLLARFAAVKKRCVLICASRLPGVPEWELKAALARWMWEDATAFRALEQRLTELRSHGFEVDKVLAYPLGDLLTEVQQGPGSLELCVGLFDVVGPAFAAGLEWYLRATQPLVDAPSVALLRGLLATERERSELGGRFLDALSSIAGGQARRAEWRAHCERFLRWAGGVTGRDPVPEAVDRPVPRAAESYRVTHEFARDERFTVAVPKRLPENLGGDERLRQMMWVRSQEMCVAETVAAVVAEWEELPSEALVDLARHCWDEVRHTLMGQAALEQEGIALASLESWVGFGRHALAESPQQALAHLSLAIEAGAMAHPGGKRGEWEYCRDVARHPLMTTFQDFDWADEITHVRYGRKWVIEHHCGGNREAARKMADDSVRQRVAFYARYGARDWMADRAGAAGSGGY